MTRSKGTLTPEETCFLLKGENFAIIPSELPIEEIIANLKPAMRTSGEKAKKPTHHFNLNRTRTTISSYVESKN